VHEKAVEAYDSILRELLSQVTERLPEHEFRPDDTPTADDRPVAKVIGSNDIDLSSFRQNVTDYTGQNTACYFVAAGRMVGLHGASHRLLDRTVSRIANDPEYRDVVGSKFIYDRAVDWLQQMTVTPQQESAFTTILSAAAAAAVEDHEFWFPLPVLRVDVTFAIGPVAFTRITKAMMDDLESRALSNSTPEEKFGFARWRALLQGTAAASVAVRAEAFLARQRAEEIVERSVSILRLACPAIMNMHMWAPLRSEFLDHVGTATALQIKCGSIIGIQTGMPEQMLSHWTINQAELERQSKRIWRAGHELLAATRNEFQEELISALFQYSRSVLKSDISERLMYVISALEALFTKKGEAIGQNLSERLAILKPPPAADRIAFKRLVDRIYDHRSAFVHGAKSVSETEGLEQFMIDAWTIFVFVLNNHSKWQTKAEFLASLDQHKFSASTFTTRGMGAG